MNLPAARPRGIKYDDDALRGRKISGVKVYGSHDKLAETIQKSESLWLMFWTQWNVETVRVLSKNCWN